MKILILKKSILLIRINPKDDCCRCLFIFFISCNDDNNTEYSIIISLKIEEEEYFLLDNY